MSDRTYAKVQVQQKTLSGSSPRSSLLQRTCACGQHTIAGAQCSTCRSEQSTLHRSQRTFEPPSAPGAVPGSSPAQENVPSFNSTFDRASRFGHDFSRIPIHPPAAGAIQTKLAINKPGDEYEQEADRITQQVMRMPEPQLQRACACGGACPKCQTEQPGQEHERLQTKRVQASDTGQIAAPPIVHEVLRSPGQPLDPATRAFMEPRFGHDFSRVRVHSGAAAEQSAQDVNAHAYTVGHDMVFGAGRFAPGTHEGRRLLAHELTHVVQQSGAEKNSVGQSDEKHGLSSISLLRPIGMFSGAFSILGGATIGHLLRKGEKADKGLLSARLNKLFSLGTIDWAMTEEDALAALEILRKMKPKEMLNAVVLMKSTGAWRTLTKELPAGDRLSLDYITQVTLNRDTGYIMPNDRIKLDFLLHGHLEEKYTREYYVPEAGVHLQQLQEPVQIAEMTPKEAADKIAKAYIDNEMFREPVVQLTVMHRGSLWKSDQGDTKKIGVLSTYHSKVGTAEGKPQGKRHDFFVYWDKIRGTPEFTLRAENVYLDELEKNLDKWETPEKLWEWTRLQASKPLAESPWQRFNALYQAQVKLLASLPPKDKELYQDALNRYSDWLDAHLHDPYIGKYKPAEIWGKAFRNALPAESKRVEAESRRKIKESHEPKVDKEAVNKKLDQVDDFLKRKGICQAKDPEYIEGKSEGAVYLVWTADAQTRKMICDDFRRDLFSHMGGSDFTRISLEDDYDDYFDRHPEQKQALSQERVERSEMEGETIATWRTVLEVMFSLWPGVNQIMGGYEALSGTEFWTGRHLSNTEQAILAAFILVPAAARIYKEAKATVTVNTLRETYSFSDAEARALFRATAPIKPGSEAAQLLEKAASDINAGRGIKTTERIKELDNLFQKMGLTDEATARAFSKRSGSLVKGVEKEVEGIASKEIKSLGTMSDDTVKMLEKNPKLRHALVENPLAAEALKLCKSLCIPEFATPGQVRRLNKLLADVENAGVKIDKARLNEYLHSRKDVVGLGEAIDRLADTSVGIKEHRIKAEAESLIDVTETFEQHGIREGKPVDIRLAEARKGQEFDVLQGQKYPTNQVPIRDKGGSLRRLDSYDPLTGEIISRKSLVTSNGQIALADEFTMIDYFQEFALKYPDGATIANVPAARKMLVNGKPLAGQTLAGKYILEVPVQKYAIPDRIMTEVRNRHITIRDINGKTY